MSGCLLAEYEISQRQALKGLPEDGTWCFVAWKNCTGEYEWAIGGYQEAEHQFYVNFGMGGMVLEEEEAVAWAELFKDEVFTAE